MANIKQAEEYDREKATTQVKTALRRWIPPAPLERVAELVDVTESALKALLPGYHVRVC